MRWVSRFSHAKNNGRNRIPPDFPDTLRRLNHLIEQLRCRRYLEIGLGNGGTFDGVTAKIKVGVDPTPWNPAVLELKNVHCCTSDDYFRLHWHSGLQFDLILLDGLHTAEQTYRDFVNSLHFAHAKTVWLIDDVIPIDVYSANPDSTEALRQREAATGRGDDLSWHGDVFKVVWMIRAFHPNATLRTFWPNQPQALVYFNAPAASSTPVSTTSLKEIGALTYDDTVTRRADYNIRDDAEIIAECVAAQRKNKMLRYRREH